MIIKTGVQILLQDHVRLIHAQHLLSGSHLLPFDHQPERMVLQKAIFEYPTLKTFFSFFDFNYELHKSINKFPSFPG